MFSLKLTILMGKTQNAQSLLLSVQFSSVLDLILPRCLTTHLMLEEHFPLAEVGWLLKGRD